VTSSRQRVDSSVITTLNLNGYDLFPYEGSVPVPDTLPGAARAPFDVTWNRATRLGGEQEWNDQATEVPLGETVEEYEVVINSTGGGTDVVKTGLTSESVTITASDTTTAGYTDGDPISITVYQKSGISAINGATGRGFGRTATI
jgi:hypothetical protein